MITIPTVFILGAGSSCSYNYPTGIILRNILCNRSHEIENNSNFKFSFQKIFEEVVPPSNDFNFELCQRYIDSFSKKFDKSGNNSIDLFLSVNQHDPNIILSGKLAIVLTMLKCEGFSKKKFNSHRIINEDWYNYLYNEMTNIFTNPKDYERLSENKISFITFNYDRSLEYYLYRCIYNNFSTSSQNYNLFDIIHVYGKIEKLNEDDLLEDYGSFDNYKKFEKILELTKKIYTIHDTNRTNERDIKKAKELIKNAQKIYFLGFNYHNTENLEILDIANIIHDNQIICGTALGFTDNQIVEIKKYFYSKSKNKNIIKKDKNNNDLIIKKMSCLELLKEYPVNSKNYVFY